jgi:hypothetical protein
MTMATIYVIGELRFIQPGGFMAILIPADQSAAFTIGVYRTSDSLKDLKLKDSVP